MAKILIVDDESSIRLLLREMVAILGHEAAEAESGQEALRMIANAGADIVLMDFRMPGMNGIEALKRIHKSKALLPVIFVTGEDGASTAIEAMRFGAHDFLKKPVSCDAVRKVIESAIETLRHQVRVEFKTSMESAEPKEKIIGRSPQMLPIYKLIGQAAASNATVLITGESGTGKELVARAVHQHSGRSGCPFVAVNCAALLENLLESTLFGHEKGSFTGAHQRHIGKFEQAAGGTIFLDEVSEMSVALQAKLLRILQEKTFERVGAEETLTCDVRVVAATNRNLDEEVENGGFRQDLYYRLNVVQIRMPPLRERREDIPLLAEYLLEQVAGELGRSEIPVLSPDALQVLLRNNWPGNIRELRNELARALVTAPSGVILREHLSVEPGTSGQADDGTFWACSKEQWDEIGEGIYDAMIPDFERRLIQYALDRTGENQVQASKLLGISRTKLRDRMAQFDL
ncbi:MAG: sigma-54 dependent transcriptional regulator [Planctomycetota bacterium]|nr:sigma-54 dependent transcriptional regulator [Planctomycetota bacterium]